MSKNTKLLLIINTLRKIIDIFLGPFLTAHLFKIATDNIQVISIYNIFSYLVIAIASLLVGQILKNKYEMQIFRIGMISKFFQLLVLIILDDNIIEYIWLLAIISGISTETWSFPLNLFSSTLVSNNEKNFFVVYKTMSTNIVKVLLPILLGSIITTESFKTTAFMILLLSSAQILLSFKLENKSKLNKKNTKLNILEEYKKIKANKQLSNFYKIKFFKGMTYEGALDTSITLLIIIAFNSDFSLGFITSIISILAVISSYICKKIIKPNTKKILMTVSCVVIFISTIFLILVTNEYTIIGYNIIFAFFMQFIIISEAVQTLKLANSNIINNSNRVESFILMELFLNTGRIVSYILLFILGIFNRLYLIEILIIFLVVSIIGIVFNLIKILEDSKQN